MAFAIFSSVVAIPALLTAGASDGTWQLLHQDTPYAVRYYDMENAVRLSPEKMQVWTKTVPTEKGNPRIKEVDSLWEFDCPRRLFRNIQTKVVYTSGDTEESHEPREWSTVRQDLWVGALQEIACEKAAERREHEVR
ncbi:MAG: surface-adhesin E family protein [Chloroflexota bacterium]